MATGHKEELVSVSSEDGYPLEGVVIRPAGKPRQDRPVVWVHGLTGRFYAPSTVAIGRHLARRGHVFVAGNNRGHDFGATLSKAGLSKAGGDRLIAGGAWELFEDSPFDVAAWVELAAGVGGGGVILLGHSLGALKVAYYQARRQDPRVRALVAASPPLRAGAWSQGILDEAERMVREGRGRDLLAWDLMDAAAGTLSAQTVLGWVRAGIDVYGERTADPAIAAVALPILAFYGTEEARVGKAEDLQTIRRNARLAPRVDTAMVEGSDHNYNGHEAEVADLIADWVESLAG